MNKVYPTLYSRTNTGAVQQWVLHLQNDEYWAVYGQVGGQLITGARTKATGKNLSKKNETSPERQAQKEADAEFKKKKEQGGYFEDINQIDQQTFFSPQLAKEWIDYKDDIDLSQGEWCTSPKLDGVRAVITYNGAFSRNGKEFKSFPHIRRLLDPLFQKDKDLVLDGEIYCHSFKDDFNKIISLAKKTKPTKQDLEESERLLEFWIFDCGCPVRHFLARICEVKKYVEEINDYRIKLVEHNAVSSENQLENRLSNYLEEGFEGLMLKNYYALYQNKRTKDVLKYKLFQDKEFKILDIIEGIGGRAGKFGYARLITETGVEFDSNARGDESFYIDLLKNKNQYIGQMATVRFQNWTPGDKPKPRFPVITSIRNYE